MEPLYLTERRAQNMLLADACRRRQRARVIVPGTDGPVTVNTRFDALELDGVLIEWPSYRSDEPPAYGELIEVQLTNDGEHYAFRASSRGAVFKPTPGDDRCLLCVEPPVRIQRRTTRMKLRYSLAGRRPIPVHFAHTCDSARVLVGRLTNISVVGVGAVIPGGPFRVLPGELYRVSFQLPVSDGPLEMVARIAHANHISDDMRLVVGASFCSVDDETLRMPQCQLIEQYICTCRRAGRGRNSRPRMHGE